MMQTIAIIIACLAGTAFVMAGGLLMYVFAVTFDRDSFIGGAFLILGAFIWLLSVRKIYHLQRENK